MRGFIIPAALTAVLATAPFALASETASGIVKSFDAKTHTLMLQDGTSYTVPMTFKDPGLKAGTKVSVAWEMKDGKHFADTVTIRK
jgi:hypothetical protein